MSTTRQVLLGISILVGVIGGFLRKPAIWLAGIGGALAAFFLEGL